MKKAKIMLAAVAVFAVVGGSLAFKAKNLNTFELFYSTLQTTGNTQADCSSTVDITYQLTPVATEPSTTAFYSTEEGICPSTTVFVTR